MIYSYGYFVQSKKEKQTYVVPLSGYYTRRIDGIVFYFEGDKFDRKYNIQELADQYGKGLLDSHEVHLTLRKILPDVYYIDNSWTQGIIFGIVSYVEENAFTDCDLNSISFRYHEKTGDTWIDDELLKTNSNTIFEEGWFNGIHSTDDEYEQLLTKLEAATADSSTLYGWWL